MSARKVIADCVTGVSNRNRFEIGVRAIEALADAGYRILGPGDLDPDTIEKCAVVADKTGAYFRNASNTRDPDVLMQMAAKEDVSGDIAASIRNLKGNGNG